MRDVVLGVLRENGPLTEAILVAILGQVEGQTATEQEWRDELANMGLKVLEYTLPCGDATGLVYIHPGCTFRVLSFL